MGVSGGWGTGEDLQTLYGCCEIACSIFPRVLSLSIFCPDELIPDLAKLVELTSTTVCFQDRRSEKASRSALTNTNPTSSSTKLI